MDKKYIITESKIRKLQGLIMECRSGLSIGETNLVIQDCFNLEEYKEVATDADIV